MVEAVRASSDAARTRDLNDRLRVDGVGGRVMLSSGVAALPTADIRRILEAVKGFDQFDPDNDPYGEHDCASVDAASFVLIWKIDYYDAALEARSPDAANPLVTRRVLTVMLADEY